MLLFLRVFDINMDVFGIFGKFGIIADKMLESVDFSRFFKDSDLYRDAVICTKIDVFVLTSVQDCSKCVKVITKLLKCMIFKGSPNFLRKG